MDRGQQLVGLDRGHVGTEIELVGADAAWPLSAVNLELGAERDGGGRQLGGWFAEHDRAADRAAVARLVMADVPRGFDEHRLLRGELGIVQQRSLPRRGADPGPGCRVGDPAHARDLVDVDEDEGLAHPQVKQRDQRLPAGDHRRPAASLRQAFKRGGDRRRSHIVERRGLHGLRPPRLPLS